MIQRETKLPRDYEVMDMVLQRGDSGELARLLSISPQLVRAWCRSPETDDEFATGKFGPLARLRTLISMIREDDRKPDRAYPIGRYIADLLSGVFVPLPVHHPAADAGILQEVSKVLRETGDAIEASRKAWFEKTPGKITAKEHSRCAAEIDEAIVALVQLKIWIEAHTNDR
ncbi:MAG: hypothetical protein VR65_10720 [Desulfobulbaceae bacterium BRH_c16a]|nr:MAG: hypothetical protein VR65_10720 [Desulfobulbaceae bacterium BRH_c16a]